MFNMYYVQKVSVEIWVYTTLQGLGEEIKCDILRVVIARLLDTMFFKFMHYIKIFWVFLNHTVDTYNMIVCSDCFI